MGSVMKLCERHRAAQGAFGVLNLDGTPLSIYNCPTDAINAFRANPR